MTEPSGQARLSPSRRELLRATGVTSLGLLTADGASTGSSAKRAESLPFAGVADPLAALLYGAGLDARSFGARFDGATDDAEALQRAVDAAHQQRQPLRLPGGVAVLGRPLSLVGRDVSIVGAGMTATVLRAGGPLPALIDVQEAGDRIISPFALMRLTLDGGGRTDRNLAVRFRHHSWLFEVNSISAKTGFWERDCWLARRYGCRSGDNQIGWHLVGSNHSSVWEACTVTACQDVHLKIGNEGSAPDGNAALVFRSCDIEFGKGHGIDVAIAANVVLESCYLGESIGGDVLRNRGFTSVRGGVFFFGGGAGVGVRPLAGQAMFDKVSVNAQAGGIANLINLSAAEAMTPGGHGRVSFTDANANLPVGGGPVLNGDPLGRTPMSVFAPRLGRDWRGWAANATIREERSPVNLPDGRAATCVNVQGPGARFGLRASLSPAKWRESEPVYLACVYRSSGPFDLMLRGPANGAARLIATLPAAESRVTYLNVTTLLPVEGLSVIEASMPAARGATLCIQELTLADGAVIRTPAGNLKTLALAQ